MSNCKNDEGNCKHSILKECVYWDFLRTNLYITFCSLFLYNLCATGL